MMPMPSEIRQILNELKIMIVRKYPLIEMKLFGSAARGEAVQDSDLDIFVRLPEVSCNIEEDLFDMAYDLELRYDCLIDLIVLSDAALRKYSEQLPIYQNILREGIPI